MAKHSRKKSNHRTDFDDVFKTMIKRMPNLSIPLINEAFDKNYSQDADIRSLSTEHHSGGKKVLDDSTLELDNRRFHFECESRKGGNIIIRMVEYDFIIGLENISEKEGGYELDFPHSCVLYLRGKNTTDTLDMKINMPDGQSLNYSVKVLWMSDYTKNKIFEKNLLFLLPYYIMNFEEDFKRLENDSAALERMLDEYRDILLWLERKLRDKGKIAEYCYMIELINRIADHLFSNCKTARKVQKGFGEVMGGKVLELETDRLLARGERKGRKEGKKEGIDLVFQIMDIIKRCPTWTTAQIAGECGCTEEDVLLVKAKIG